MSTVRQAFWEELKKIAQEKETTTDKVLKAAPGVGAVAGGVWGGLDPKAFAPKSLMPRLVKSNRSLGGRAVSAVLGAGMGATTAWLPSAVRDTYRTLKPQGNIPKVASGLPPMVREAMLRELSTLL